MTPISCRFLFHDTLNDFLPKRRKGQWISYTTVSTASVKDIIEAFGIPHVEVMKLTVGGFVKPLNCLLQPDDAIEVYPYPGNFPENAPKAFVLDVHLGTLARQLRMLGIDASYQNDYTDGDIISIAVQENRAVLTRDVGLLKHKVLQSGYWLRSQQPAEQTIAVIKWFSLCQNLSPFSRCTACNGLILPTAKTEIGHLLPAQTRESFGEFYHCSQCEKIYWKGSHYLHMEQLIKQIRSVAC